MNEVEQSLLFGVSAVIVTGTLVFFVVQYFRRDDDD